MKAWRIVYTWQGERHVTLTSYPTISAARKALRTFHADRWNAWIEECIISPRWKEAA